ncbi:hypothetical protein HanRHA438_Chr06g0263551 [Helianthus annuus]|nr:hypothetical protein HanRHA438_Chr06g0263551 [Helianthus annuus]
MNQKQNFGSKYTPMFHLWLRILLSAEPCQRRFWTKGIRLFFIARGSSPTYPLRCAPTRLTYNNIIFFHPESKGYVYHKKYPQS